MATTLAKTKAALKKIEKILADLDDLDRHAVWSVLTALRGPDIDPGGNEEDKLSTTAVIRQAAFPRIAGVSGALFVSDSAGRAARRRVGGFPSSHFEGHVRNAFKALGLDWDKNNQE